MKAILKDRSFKLSILLSLLFLGIGFAFLHFELIAYGWFFFIVLPIVLGISIGALPHKNWAIYGLLTGLLIFLVLLLAGELEGFICVLMALPILIPLLFLGYIISHLFKRYKLLKANDNLKILVLPFFLFLFGGPLEKSLSDNNKQIIEVRSEILLPYSSMQVYDAIKSVDTLDAEKPFLMKIDLPIPQKCILEKEAVGALRTCYFEGGKIVERITALEKGKLLKMDVIDYELTGRKWLGFKEAIYLFEEVAPGKCKMTRITTYTSELNPRAYWQPLEKIGIEQEHEYVFNNLKKDLERKF